MNKRLYLYSLLLCLASGSMSLLVHAAAVDLKEPSSAPAVLVGGKRPLEVRIPEKSPVIDREYLPSSQRKDTPLVRAIREKNQKKVEELITEKRVNVGYQNNLGQTALMLAVDYNNMDAARFLIDKASPTINLQDDKGDTALIYAISAGNHPMVEVLLAHGADPLIANRDQNEQGIKVPDQNPLMIAARHNDVQSIQLLFNVLTEIAKQKNSSLAREIAYIDRNGDTALQIAMRWHKHEAEKLLLEATGPVDQDAIQLINAAKVGDVKTVKALLAKKVAVNYQYAAQTPLTAALHGDALPAMRTIVTALLEAGASPNVVDVHGRTPLSILASRHFDDSWKNRNKMKDAPLFSQMRCNIIEILLKAGADIEGTIALQRHPTPLIAAIMNFNPDVAELLIQNGANIKAQYDHRTVEDYIQNVFKKVNEESEAYDQWVAIQFDVKKKLQQAAGPVDPRAEQLIAAARAGDAKTVGFLLQLGVNVNSYQAGQTPLLAAVSGKNKDAMRTVDTVKLLLDTGAKPNIVDAAGNSPLALLAAQHFDPNWHVHMRDSTIVSKLQCQAIAALLDAGAHINGGNQPPLIAAIRNFNAEVAEFLIKRGADVKVRYVGGSVLDYVKLIFSKIGPEHEVYDQWARIQFAIAIMLSPLADKAEGALLQSINYGNVKEVAELLTYAVDVNIVFNAYTPLTLAIARNNVAIMQQLIAAGADINKKNELGLTPLMMVLIDGYVEPARCLLESRADIHMTDNVGSTPLMYFAASPLNEKADIDILTLLLKGGAWVTARNKAGQTVFDFLKLNNHPLTDPKIKAEIERLLQEEAKREIDAEKERERGS